MELDPRSEVNTIYNSSHVTQVCLLIGQHDDWWRHSAPGLVDPMNNSLDLSTFFLSFLSSQLYLICQSINLFPFQFNSSLCLLYKDATTGFCSSPGSRRQPTRTSWKNNNIGNKPTGIVKLLAGILFENIPLKIFCWDMINLDTCFHLRISFVFNEKSA